jgi:RsiW-degrading membrane proteinase PrsW (M82 family)
MITLIYVVAALLPAVFLMRYIYKKDMIEKEPPALLFKLLLGGCGAAFVAVILEQIGGYIINMFAYPSENMYAVVTAIMVGLSEEFAKMFFLKRITWRNPEFNYRFDGLVYAVFVSLGFAALENVLYVFQYGLGVAASRAVLSVPAHMAFAVFMGSFYGRAKVCELYNDPQSMKTNLWLGFLSAVILHSFYDACVMMDSDIAMGVFIIFVIAMYIIVIAKVRHEARTDYRM